MFPRREFIAACLFFILSLSGFGQDTGTLVGVVTDADNGAPVVGARVEVTGIGLYTSTFVGGQFRLTNVPTGARKISVSAVGYDTVSQPASVQPGTNSELTVQLKSAIVTMGVFKVSTYASMEASALSQQRQSNQISNVISSDSLGDMPDANLRMALNRLPGVDVAQGDDGQVSIRGMKGSFNAITINGDSFPSAATNLSGFGDQGFDRALDLMKLPTQGIQSLVVVKTPTADMDGDSIGGHVDMILATPFDYHGRVSRVSTEFTSYQFGGNGFNDDIMYSDILNSAKTVGVLFTANWQDYSREFGQYNLTSQNPQSALTGVPNQVDEINPNQQLEKTKQLSLNTTVTWKLSPSTTLTFTGWYNGQNRYDDRPRVQVQLKAVTAANIGPSGLTASGTGKINIRKRDRYRPNRDFQQYRLGFTGKTVLGNNTFDYGLTAGGSTFTATEYDYQYNAAASNASWSWDRTKDLAFPTYTVSVPGVDIFNDPTKYVASTISKQTLDNYENIVTMHTDWTVALKGAVPFSLKTGFKGRVDDRSGSGTYRVWPGGKATFANFGGTIPYSTYDRFQELGFRGNDAGFAAFFDQNMNDTTLFGVENVKSGAETAAESLEKQIREAIWAGYTMGTADFGNLRVIGGIRYELTDGSYGWPAARANTATVHLNDVTNNVKYGTVVPSVLGIYRFSKNDVLRFGWSETLARPDWDSLVPVDTSLVLSQIDPTALEASTVIPVTVPNPNLRAQRSNNLDLGFEHYYGASNLISASVFVKQMNNYIGNPIVRATTQQAVDPLTGIPLVTSKGLPVYFQVGRVENGVIQNVDGVELNWQHRFNLRGFFNGLGFAMNYTLMDGRRKAPQFNDPAHPYTITGYNFYNQVESQPTHIFHGQVYWEKRGWSARVGYVYNGAQVDTFDKAAPGVNLMDSPFKSVDASLSYQFKNGWSIYVEGNNLTREPEGAQYYMIQNYITTWDMNGSSWTAGVRAVF